MATPALACSTLRASGVGGLGASGFRGQDFKALDVGLGFVGEVASGDWGTFHNRTRSSS